jgi:lipopolysaccharide biosynthesis regulator YciM
MPSPAKDIVAVRQEMLNLLRQQMEALDSPEGMTDSQLMECYHRQARVQELRDRLQACLNSEQENAAVIADLSTSEITPAVFSAS